MEEPSKTISQKQGTEKVQSKNKKKLSKKPKQSKQKPPKENKQADTKEDSVKTENNKEKKKDDVKSEKSSTKEEQSKPQQKRKNENSQDEPPKKKKRRHRTYSKKKKKKKTTFTTIYVSNLPNKLKPPQIREIFEKYGPIEDIYVPLHKDCKNRQRNKGKAFIKFEKHEDAKNALSFNGETVLDRVISVKVCTSKPREPKTEESDETTSAAVQEE